MRLLNTLAHLGRRLRGSYRLDDAHSTASRVRICRFEQIEQRQMMTATPAPVEVGITEVDSGTADKSQPNLFQVSFQGGAPGTELTQLVIDTSKNGGPLAVNDLVFNTTAGGIGTADPQPFTVVSASGFQVTGDQVQNDSSLLTIDLSGFKAGDTLTFSIGVEQVTAIDPVTSAVTLGAVVTGAAFSGATASATFVAVGYSSTEAPLTFVDQYNSAFAAANQQSGSQLTLPADPDLPSDLNAGAVGVLTQPPLPRDLVGVVFNDLNLDGQQESNEQGVAGVQLALYQWNGTQYISTGKTATTDANGDYDFASLLPGTYEVVKTNPAGYIGVAATAGTLDGDTDGTATSPDVISGIVLQAGGCNCNCVNNNFAISQPAAISGYVYYDANDDGQREAGELGIGGVRLQIVPINVVGTPPSAPIQVVTAADGSYSVSGLNPGTWEVEEVTQPPGYLDGVDRAGTAGGLAINPGDKIENINLGDGQSGQEYDFGKLLPNSISGRVLVSDTPVCTDDPNPTPLANVTLQLLNSSNQIVGTTTTDQNGNYSFTGLGAGTYSVQEVPPAGYIEGCDTVGSVGGQKPTNLLLSSIVLISNTNGINYNFYEHPYSSLSGNVYLDANDNLQNSTSDPTLSGVTVNLLNSTGQVIATTQTNANGAYTFSQLTPGTYSVQELQPNGYYYESALAGTVGGTVADDHDLTQIALPMANNAQNYNFWVLPPAHLSGNVYIDTADDHLNSTSDPTLSGVTIELLNSTGQVVATTQTSSNGNYSFSPVAPGTYTIEELQPVGYYYEDAVPGTVGGTATDSHDIGQLTVPAGVNGQNYNFWLLPPGDISGYVYYDSNDDGTYDTPDTPVAGVTVALLNSSGQPTGATAVTDASGHYEFANLPVGNYGVAETLPSGYFAGATNVGNSGGTAVGQTIVGASVVPGKDAANYDFGLLLPASLTGRVMVNLTGEDCNESWTLPGVPNVTVNLLNANNQIVATTVTDANGNYAFNNLTPGVKFSVQEILPANYYAEDATPGDAGGTKVDDEDLDGLTLASGQAAMCYDFYIVPPASLTGRVMINSSGLDCDETWTLPGVPNVTVNLLNANNQVVATTVTDANGDYAFTNLQPGVQYSVQEIVPADYFAEAATPGDAGGTATDAEDIVGLVLTPAQASMCYDFYIMPPASLTGRVMINTTGLDCNESWTLPGVPNVTVNLLNASNQIVATTVTDSDGDYAFKNLMPGTYSIQEVPPASYFAEDATPGDAGGNTANPEDIVGLTLTPGQAAMCYDFYVMPPATISGTVFQDGPPIQTVPGQSVDVPAVRTGVLVAGDPRIAGVTLQLVNGVTGAPIYGSQALPGYYNPTAPITTVTDANGNYSFNGLPAGNYAVVETEPQGYVDGITTAGSTGGVVVGPYTQTSAAALAGLTVPVPHDAILQIVVTAGQTSTSNNFSVVQTQVIYLIQPLPVGGPAGAYANAYSQYQPVVYLWQQPPVVPPPPAYSGSSQILDYSWHLSVVNAGQPRGGSDPTLVQLTAAQAEELAWQAGMEDSEWTLAGRATGRNADAARRLLFGMRGGIPVSGDFNGDGVTDVGVFRNGQWFIDVNGNGVWDEGDLWAKLGYDGDKPVVGDWDGDGKDDIGIFGRAWAGDPRHIAREPGLPDSSNKHYGNQKNVPPPQQQATIGKRALKLTSQGTTRADLIDHVFHYGTPRDIPLVGDWNGDGTDTIAVFRDGWWYLDIDGDGKWTDEGDNKRHFGQAGDIPVAGDFNGDGVDELAVFRQGTWYIDTNGNGQIDGQDQVVQLGQAGDVPVVGDWDGDGHEEIGTYRDGEIAKSTARK